MKLNKDGFLVIVDPNAETIRNAFGCNIQDIDYCHTSIEQLMEADFENGSVNIERMYGSFNRIFTDPKLREVAVTELLSLTARLYVKERDQSEAMNVMAEHLPFDLPKIERNTQSFGVCECENCKKERENN